MVGGIKGNSPMQVRATDTDNSKPSFKETWGRIQAEMGARPKKQRVIKKSLDKDDFLRIMIMQMKNQDPTKPFETDKLAQEIAQITSVEQFANMNKNLTNLSKQNKPIEKLAMVNLIGKTVTVDRSRFPHEKGSTEVLSYKLPEDAAEVKIALVSSAGEVVVVKELTDKKSGSHEFVWDGNKDNSIEADGGKYSLRITAVNDRGKSITINTKAKANIIGVSLAGDEPYFLVGDAKSNSKVAMSDISMIEVGTGTMPPMQGNKTALQAQQKARPKLEAHEAGKKARSQQRHALKPVMAPTQKPSVPKQNTSPVSKGFPNGLGMYNQAMSGKNMINTKGGEKK